MGSKHTTEKFLDEGEGAPSAARPAFIKERVEVEVEATETDADLARRLRVLKDDKEATEARLKEINSKIDGLSIQLAESMEAHGVDSFKVAGVGSVYVQTLNRPRILDADAFLVWLDTRGAAAMAPRTVHWKRLESLVKEMLEGAEALPESLSNFQQKRAVIRRA